MEIKVYTNYSVITYTIKWNASVTELARALVDDPVLLETIDGESIIINPLQAVLIEIKEKK
jgi:hypothetical protein